MSSKSPSASDVKPPGEYITGWQPTMLRCRHCNHRGAVQFRVWQSACTGVEDLVCHCAACEHKWWIVGLDEEIT